MEASSSKLIPPKVVKGGPVLENVLEGEQINLYNFPQNRVTDHRIGLTTHKLQQVLDGELDEIIDALAFSDEQARLAEATS